MTKTMHGAAGKHIFCKAILSKAILAACALCAWATSVNAQTPAQAVEQKAAPAYVYWTNSLNGTIGQATTTGTDVNEDFITTGEGVGGGGLTLNKDYVYWSGANGGSATNIGRAYLNGTDPDDDFITGASNPCGVAVNKTYIYWAGDVGSFIGRANLDGSGVNQDFIETGNGVCGVAVSGSHIYWANYESASIGRATTKGTDVDPNFITGAGSGSGIAIHGKYIYFTSNGGTGIGRANLNGTDVNPNFITGLDGEIAFLAVDAKYIFWADWGDRGTCNNPGPTCTIGRANIDGTGVNQSFITGTDGGFGIAVTDGNP